MDTQSLIHTWLGTGILLAILVLTLSILFYRPFRRSTFWHATITPLASIIGSGFLVCAPLLVLIAGHWAPLAMTGIVLIAYGLGSSIRFNILNTEHQLAEVSPSSRLIQLDTLSRFILGCAYIISIAFYLKLLSAFGLRWFGIENARLENLLTTIIMIAIGFSGQRKGLSFLEVQEVYAVNFKLAIITMLICGLLFYNIHAIFYNHFKLPSIELSESLPQVFRKLLGILIIVQGFETSRYLGHTYSPQIRAKTMRYAQWISGVIYIAFMALCLILLKGDRVVSETLIIHLSKQVSWVLPALITLAAIMSQFSAAVADTVGSSGILIESFKNTIATKYGYIIIAAAVISLTWSVNIFSIISIASKAFAIYYALQLIESLLIIKQKKMSIFRYILYFPLLLLMILVITIGIPVAA